MFVDTLNDHYLGFYEKMSGPYASWKMYTYEEQDALDRIHRESMLKKILGGRPWSWGCSCPATAAARPRPRDAAIIGGGLVLQSGFQQGAGQGRAPGRAQGARHFLRRRRGPPPRGGGGSAAEAHGTGRDPVRGLARAAAAGPLPRDGEAHRPQRRAVVAGAHDVSLTRPALTTDHEENTGRSAPRVSTGRLLAFASLFAAGVVVFGLLPRWTTDPVVTTDPGSADAPTARIPLPAAPTSLAPATPPARRDRRSAAQSARRRATLTDPLAPSAIHAPSATAPEKPASAAVADPPAASPPVGRVRRRDDRGARGRRAGRLGRGSGRVRTGRSPAPGHGRRARRPGAGRFGAAGRGPRRAPAARGSRGAARRLADGAPASTKPPSGSSPRCASPSRAAHARASAPRSPAGSTAISGGPTVFPPRRSPRRPRWRSIARPRSRRRDRSLRRQIEELRARLAAARTPVPVRLLSDERTEVSVLRVGPMGRFREKALELRPGSYVVVGHSPRLPRHPPHARGASRPEPGAPRRALPRGPLSEPLLIEPIPFEPRPLRMARATRRPRRRLPPAALAGLVALLLVLALLFSARAVEIQVEPAPERVSVSGWPHFKAGSLRLMLPGRYTLHAEKARYLPLEAPFEVTSDPRQIARFALELRPGPSRHSTYTGQRCARHRRRVGARSDAPGAARASGRRVRGPACGRRATRPSRRGSRFWAEARPKPSRPRCSRIGPR